MPNPKSDSPPKSLTLLGTDDLPPFIVTNEGGPSPFLLLGDHAGRAIPKALGDLGVPAEAMDRHIAWDIGVAGLGDRLAVSLDACFIRQTYSRLVIDCNRAPTAPDAMPAISDGQAIPANTGEPMLAQARRDEIHAPYQAAIARLLDARAAAGQRTLLISLHSFTPSMRGFDRPWRYGVLHRGDSELSRRALAWLRDQLGEALVGDNQPYAMDIIDYTIPLHADARGLDYLELEVRQDLLADTAGQVAVTALVGAMLTHLALD